jgi:hypothetical protein
LAGKENEDRRITMNKSRQMAAFILMRWGGLEPPRLAAHAPQACLSASSSTSAQAGRIIIRLHRLSSKTFTTGLLRLEM